MLTKPSDIWTMMKKIMTIVMVMVMIMLIVTCLPTFQLKEHLRPKIAGSRIFTVLGK